MARFRTASPSKPLFALAALACALALACAFAPRAYADDIAGGICGECTWTIDADGLLTIRPTNGVSGMLADSKGDGPDSASSYFPWNYFGESVRKVQVEDGVVAGSSICGMFMMLGQGESPDVEYIDLGNFDTSNVTDMSWMFGYCVVRNTVTLNIDTSNVTNMSWMFGYSSLLGGWRIDDGKTWDTSNVTTMRGMFYGLGYGGPGIDEISIPFSTASVVDMDAMFMCTNIKRLDLSGLDNGNATMSLAFAESYGIEELVVGQRFDFTKLDVMPGLGAQSERSNWWSMGAQRWFTPDEVRATRSGIADTYYSTEVRDREMRRLYNRWSHEHFYTGDEAERDLLVGFGWTDEGVGWTAPSSGEPVYRVYNRWSGEHHFTMGASERDLLVGIGWVDEGVGWFSEGAWGAPVYRLFNPWATENTHHYTADASERALLVGIGWRDEGIGWYGLS